MPYATRDDLAARYGERELVQTSDKARPPSGVADEDVIARALTDADAEVDSRLGIRYRVPLPLPASPILVDHACRIARYKLHEDRATEKIRRDYEDALRFLGDVAAGRAMIPGIGAGTPGASSGAAAVVSPPRRITDAVMERMP